MAVEKDPAEAAVELERALLIPGGELILDALGPFHRGSRVLELGGGRGVLSRSLKERAVHTGASLLVVEPDPALAEALPDDIARAQAEGRGLPFDDASFEHVVANLRLGRRTADPALLREIGRVLRPFGRLTATLLVAGSFDTLLDLFLEASEHEDLRELGAALREARGELLSVEEAAAELADAGFEVTASGICERALAFEDGASALADPLGRGAFLTALRPPSEPAVEVAPTALARVRDAIDTYFGEGGLTVVIKTAVVCAEVATKDLHFSAVTQANVLPER